MGDCRRAGFIRSGKLIGVCDDTKADEFVISCYKDNKKISYERTIEESGFGRNQDMTEIYNKSRGGRSYFSELIYGFFLWKELWV